VSVYSGKCFGQAILLSGWIPRPSVREVHSCISRGPSPEAKHLTPGGSWADSELNAEQTCECSSQVKKTEWYAIDWNSILGLWRGFTLISALIGHINSHYCNCHFDESSSWRLDFEHRLNHLWPGSSKGRAEVLANFNQRSLAKWPHLGWDGDIAPGSITSWMESL